MCHSLTPVTVHAPRRKVLRCSCGSLHVVWENLNLSLSPAEFGDLLTLVQSGAGTLNAWHLHRGEGGVGLWYGAFGATLPSADFSGFVALLRAAHGLPHTPPRAAYALN